MTQHLYVLFEHAAGYALFKVKEFEEIGVLLPQVAACNADASRFSHLVKLVSFAPFKSAVVALENINSISEGILTETLQVFLDKNVPQSTKKEKVILCVGESKLAASIVETLNITCQHTGATQELLRGIRAHFHKLVTGFTLQSCGIAQLGLGHSYSRAKVKFNVHRVDNMIIQSIALLDQLDKDINTFSMRLREWYSYHFPELVKIVPDNYLYAKVLHFIKNRKDLSEASLEGLEELVMDSAKAQSILDASRSSMGMDISIIDLMNIERFAVRVVSLADYRKELTEYLHSKMTGVAPNLATLVGDQVGARLISHAGSLTNLAKYPASTVQILGAEKALFRALKTKSNTPKYGLLFNSTFIGRASQKNKGRISRYVANKCSIASRIDCFSDIQTSVFGEKLRQQVEDRLKYYETGEKPRPNAEVMTEAVEDALKEAAMGKKKKKKDKKRKHSENGGVLEESGMDFGDESINAVTEENSEPVKKKKKKKKKSLVNDDATAENSMDLQNESVNRPEENGGPLKKKKKKKKSISVE